MKTPKVGDLLQCVAQAIIFPRWEYDGEKPDWIKPGKMAVFLEERADYSDDFTVFWKVISTDGQTGWAPSASFRMI